MKTHSLIIHARDALETLTPLNTDCGQLCGGRCCQASDAGEGMLLFPTEECLYRNSPWAHVFPSPIPGVKMVTCDGVCPRVERPLACRIFPLTPYMKNGRLRIRMDERSKFMCPLYSSGVEGLDGRFMDAVRNAMYALMFDDGQRAFLKTVTDEIDDFVRLTRLSGRD